MLLLMPLLPAAWVVPAAAHVHIRLDRSSPAPDEILTASPSQLRLLYSGRIEARYTAVTLTGPDGARVAVGDVVFVAGSDREITLQVPPLERPGRYTVNWRTAGADGHVLEGSYAFVLAPDTTGVSDTDASGGAGADGVGADSAGPGGSAAAGDGDPETARRNGLSGGQAPGSSDDMHGHHAEPETVGGVRDAIARGLHFVALLLLLGGVTLRAVLMPRIAATPALRTILQRRVWRAIAGAAILLAVSAVLRLWFQSIALHGEERAWNSELLSIMLTDTGWGRAWLLQALLFALLGMAIVWARPGRDRAGLVVAVIAALGLSAIPALSGHAAGAQGIARMIVLNDALHVTAAGAWLGTLALLMLGAIPALRRVEPGGDAAAADAIDAFSPLALTAGATVLLSGVINALMHLSTPAQLWTTEYGRVLLVKLLLVGAVGAAGVINWRLVRSRLRAADGLRRLRASAAAELTFALLVIAVTAVLTGQPRP